MPHTTFAHDSFVTIVNPVRISAYTTDVSKSIQAQAAVVATFNFPATWLLTPEVLDTPTAITELKKLPTTNELGLFLEISEKLANDAQVSYKKPEHWYHPNALFLSGYTQSERIKLIDTLFKKFKEQFRYFPTSVGSWGTDSFSLSYMQKTYGVTANLMCTDQYATDNYQLWGQFWQAPYYPSKIHAGEPGTIESEIPIVEMQWAPRDPLHGYESSLYSTQDYFTVKDNLGIDYFQKLIESYLFDEHNSFGQVVVGLEGDFNPETYSQHFKEQLTVVSNLQKDKGVKVTNMKDFSSWYKNNFKVTPPTHFVTKDLLGGPVTTEWYESTSYRIGMKYEDKNSQLSIFDFRVYDPNFMESYYLFPNRQNTLSLVIPSVIDTKINPSAVWNLNVSRQDIELSPTGILIKKQTDVPANIKDSPLITLSTNNENTTITPTTWNYAPEGQSVKYLKPEVKSLLNSHKVQLILFLGLLLLLFISFKGYRKITVVLILFGYLFFQSQAYASYIVLPGELQALQFLRAQPEGRVLTKGTVCLQCAFQSHDTPAAFTGERRYVTDISNKKIVTDDSVFTVDREHIHEAFQKTGATYIYLVKIGDYIENLPYSPGDSGVKKIFENADATIWQKE